MGRTILFSEPEIQDRVRELAVQISHDYRGQDVVLVGLLKGAFMFLRDLGVALERIKETGEGVHDIYIEFLSIGSYGDGQQSGALELKMDTRRPVGNAHVIIVEDVADTCKTLSWVSAHLQKQEPATLRICVLVAKPDRHEAVVRLHYVGFSQANLPFLGGYGLDVEGADRCIPYIFEVPLTSPE